MSFDDLFCPYLEYPLCCTSCVLINSFCFLCSLSTALFRVQKFQHTGIRGHRYIIVCCTETEEELGGELREREREGERERERKRVRKGEGGR